MWQPRPACARLHHTVARIERRGFITPGLESSTQSLTATRQHYPSSASPAQPVSHGAILFADLAKGDAHRRFGRLLGGDGVAHGGAGSRLYSLALFAADFLAFFFARLLPLPMSALAAR